MERCPFVPEPFALQRLVAWSKGVSCIHLKLIDNVASPGRHSNPSAAHQNLGESPMSPTSDRKEIVHRQPGITNIFNGSTVDVGKNETIERSLLEPAQAEGELGWFQHYRVLLRLGQGGMGIVYRAEDTHLQRHVALKIMNPNMAAD